MRQHSKHIHSAHHHFAISYPVSLSQRIYTLILGPLAVVAVVYFITVLYPALAAPSGAPITWTTIVAATMATMARLLIAYALALVCAVPLAILVTMNRTVEELLLPVFDILQSVPILALFPVVVILFVNVGFLNGAAIFILFASMLWSLVFTLVGGLKIIPHDITDAAHIFGVRGFAYVRRVLLPALVPQFVTGSILAVAQGWNIIIVAEVLRTYIPGGTSAQDLFGIGSILVDASANAQNAVFVKAVFAIIVVIAFINFFVWQKLLHYAQRFRFE